jgi:hypothetical protein
MTTSLKKALKFIHQNKNALTGMTVGSVLAFLYWWHFGIYWGVYPLSSECWVNCVYGCLFGGLVGSILSNKELLMG